MDQTRSVFIPGLTRRGPVYNSTYGFGGLYERAEANRVKFAGMPFMNQGLNGLGALTLPALPAVVQYGAMAALLALAAFKKIPMIPAIGGAAALYLFPTATPGATTAVASTTPPDLTTALAAATASLQNMPTPTLPPISTDTTGMSGLFARGNSLRFRP
jgi:hypothetical protein